MKAYFAYWSLQHLPVYKAFCNTKVNVDLILPIYTSKIWLHHPKITYLDSYINVNFTDKCTEHMLEYPVNAYNRVILATYQYAYILKSGANRAILIADLESARLI